MSHRSTSGPPRPAAGPREGSALAPERICEDTTAPQDAPALALRAGDVVVSPHHGVGRVVERRVRRLLGAQREYITVEVPRRQVRLMIPANEVARAGLRPVASPAALHHALEVLAAAPEPAADNWQHRQKRAAHKLATGAVSLLAEVVREYAHAAALKPLGVTDRDLYTRGREFLEAELAIALEIDDEAASAAIDSRLPAPAAKA